MVCSCFFCRSRAYSHDVKAPILVFQTNPVGVGLFSYVRNSLVLKNFHRCLPREWIRSPQRSHKLHRYWTRAWQRTLVFPILSKSVNKAPSRFQYFKSCPDVYWGGAWYKKVLSFDILFEESNTVTSFYFGCTQVTGKELQGKLYFLSSETYMEHLWKSY